MTTQVNSETFATKGQYNKYTRIKAFFEKLINLKEDGYFFLVDDEVYKEPYIEGVEMGFKEGLCSIVFVGGTYTYNKETGEFDIPWIDITMKGLRERIIPLKRATL